VAHSALKFAFNTNTVLMFTWSIGQLDTHEHVHGFHGMKEKYFVTERFAVFQREFITMQLVRDLRRRTRIFVFPKDAKDDY